MPNFVRLLGLSVVPTKTNCDKDWYFITRTSHTGCRSIPEKREKNGKKKFMPTTTTGKLVVVIIVVGAFLVTASFNSNRRWPACCCCWPCSEGGRAVLVTALLHAHTCTSLHSTAFFLSRKRTLEIMLHRDHRTHKRPMDMRTAKRWKKKTT